MIATMMIPVGDDCFPQTNRVTTQRKIIIFIVRRYKYYFRSLLFFIFFIFFVHQHGENFLLMQYVWYIFLSLHLFLFYSYWYFSPSAVYSPFFLSLSIRLLSLSIRLWSAPFYLFLPTPACRFLLPLFCPSPLQLQLLSVSFSPFLPSPTPLALPPTRSSLLSRCPTKNKNPFDCNEFSTSTLLIEVKTFRFFKNFRFIIVVHSEYGWNSLCFRYSSQIFTRQSAAGISVIQSQCQKRTDILRFTKYVEDVSSICGIHADAFSLLLLRTMQTAHFIRKIYFSLYALTFMPLDFFSLIILFSFRSLHPLSSLDTVLRREHLPWNGFLCRHCSLLLTLNYNWEQIYLLIWRYDNHICNHIRLFELYFHTPKHLMYFFIESVRLYSQWAWYSLMFTIRANLWIPFGIQRYETESVFAFYLKMRGVRIDICTRYVSDSQIVQDNRSECFFMSNAIGLCSTFNAVATWFL